MMRKHTRATGRVRRPAARIVLMGAAVALLALMVAGPVMAKPATPKAKVRPFVAQTTFISATADTVLATVVKGNRAMKPSIGKDVTFTLADKVVIVKVTKDGSTLVGVGDLVAGDRVMIHGRVLLADPAPVFKAWLLIDRGVRPPKT